MAALPWFMYVVVGVIVSVYSRMVMNKSGITYTMKMFFYLGVVFFGIGMYKFLMQYWRRVPQKGHRPSDPSVMVCKVCGTKNYVTSYFCHICGTKMEKKPVPRS